MDLNTSNERVEQQVQAVDEDRMRYARFKDHLFGHVFTMQAHFVGKIFAEFSDLCSSIVFVPVLMTSRHLCLIFVKPEDCRKF